MSESYPIGTLAQIAMIPEDALPRFLAELPIMLSLIRDTAALNEAVGDILGATAEFERMEWVDDDKQQATFCIESGDKEIGSFSMPFGELA